eukprot:4864401-Prymnesium_polylepis.1
MCIRDSGDMCPVTLPGKLVALAAMGMGVLSIAMPVTVVAANFAEQYMLKQVHASPGMHTRASGSPCTHARSLAHAACA